MWAERFERERRDVLALQRELALAIARAVEVALTPQDRARLAEAPAVDPEAFELYVKGAQARYRMTGPEDVAKAAIDGADKGKRVVIPGVGNRASAWFGRHGPQSVVLGPMANAYRRVIGE